MKPRYLIGALIIAAFMILGLLSLEDSAIEYTDIDSAKESGRKVQIIGAWLQDRASGYDAEKNEFTFCIKDQEGSEAKIILNGMKPQNFETAPSVVVKGRFVDSVFRASEVLTKCPSKYESEL